MPMRRATSGRARNAWTVASGKSAAISAVTRSAPPYASMKSWVMTTLIGGRHDRPPAPDAAPRVLAVGVDHVGLAAAAAAQAPRGQQRGGQQQGAAREGRHLPVPVDEAV